MSAEFKIRPYQGGDDRRQLELTRLPEMYISQYTNSSPFYFTLKVLGICTNYLYLMTPCDSPDIVGTLLLRKRLQGFPARYVWKIHAVGVAPELRGRGLGGKLLNYAFERLRERGAEEVSLKVDATNEPAIRLYRKFGFTERATIEDQIIFVKRVNERA
jgi:ribosomal protein S18 acetylase RimI-like enzyme